MNYGWTVDHILGMPARRFFAVAKAGRDIFDQRINLILYELCSVSAVASQNSDYYKDLRAQYWAWAYPDVKAPTSGKEYDIANKNQGMAAFMNLAMMMRGGGRG